MAPPPAPADETNDTAQPEAPSAGLRGPTPLFLHRETYRRRRIMDGARALPIFGAAFLLLPVLWAPDHLTAQGAIYIFIVWFALILLAGIMARKLAEPLRKKTGNGSPAGEGAPGPDSG